MRLQHEDFKAHIGNVQQALSEETVRPFYAIAEMELRKRIGKPLFSWLGGEEPEAEAADWQELRTLCTGWMSWYAFSKAMPHMKFRFGDLGIMKESPANSIAVTKWEYVDTKEANLEMQDVYLELIFEYLEEEQPTVWKQSDAYKMRQQHFIRSAAELAKLVPAVGKSSRFFERLLVYIERAEELYIRPVLTTPDYIVLKEKWEGGTITAADRSVINTIKIATAHLALYEAYPYLPLVMDEHGIRQDRSKDGIREEEMPEARFLNSQRRAYLKDGELYLGVLKKLLTELATPTVFPSFYQSLQTNPVQEEDFTDYPHIIL